MRECKCKKRTCVLWVVLIGIFTLLSLGNLILSLWYPSSGVHQQGMYGNSVLLPWLGTFMIWGCIGIMIYYFYKSAASRILFDDDKMILIVSPRDRRTFTWEELRSEGIQIYLTHINFSRDNLLFVFSDGKRLLLPHNFKGYSELCQLLQIHGVLDYYGIRLTAREQWAKEVDDRGRYTKR